MILNMVGGKVSKDVSQIIITAPPESIVTVEDLGSEDHKMMSGIFENDTWIFSNCPSGSYRITATREDKSTFYDLIIPSGAEQLLKYIVSLAYSAKIRDFDLASYGELGVDYKVEDDNGEPIDKSQWETAEHFRILLLTSGTLRMSRDARIDVFLVGGGGGGSSYGSGGGGGGGGYTTTAKAIALDAHSEHTIEIGAGGAVVKSKAGENGGTTSAFEISAPGGQGGGPAGTTAVKNGGDGGSGGGPSGKGSAFRLGYPGGSDGSDAITVSASGGTSKGGVGQHTTTREFGEESGKLYSGGGGGGTNSIDDGRRPGGAGGEGGGGAGGGDYNYTREGTPGTPNSGGGGGGGAHEYLAGIGGSGIVVIRDTRGG